MCDGRMGGGRQRALDGLANESGRGARNGKIGLVLEPEIMTTAQQRGSEENE